MVAVAGCVRAAWLDVGQANWDALSVDTAVLGRASVVVPAADGAATDFGVAFVAGLAGADGFVVSDATLCVRAAVAWIAANAVEAGAVGGALAVGDTSRFGDCRDGLAGAAAAADVPGWTDAVHGSHW